MHSKILIFILFCIGKNPKEKKGKDKNKSKNRVVLVLTVGKVTFIIIRVRIWDIYSHSSHLSYYLEASDPYLF